MERRRALLIRGLLALLCWVLASPAWAFPDNGVLDTFTGVDNTTPPNANWTNAPLLGPTSVNVDLEDNAVTSASGSEGDAYWNPTTFGADCEAYATIVNVASTTFGTVFCRLANIGANTTDGYAVYWADGTSVVGIGIVTNGVYTELTSTISQAIAVGDKFGIKTVGDQICAWFWDASGAAVWVELGCRTDGTYTAGGHIGLSVQGTGTVGALDDFGGGNVAASAPATPTALHLAGDSSTSATFIWAPNAETDLTGYKVYVGTVSGQTNTLLATITAASAAASHSPMTRFQHRRLVAGTLYYTVAAYNPTGESAQSSEISSTVAGMAARSPLTQARAPRLPNN